tara:strand:+ start:612 stop:878 length:267 start_codon:yes stop_codon:yes gene_type:complete
VFILFGGRIMFTVEFESDAAVITTLDQNDNFEDVEMVIADNGIVYMRQYDEKMDDYQMLFMSYQQFTDIIASHRRPEGMYKIAKEKDQ